jgi:hypothetical protein
MSLHSQVEPETGHSCWGLYQSVILQDLTGKSENVNLIVTSFSKPALRPAEKDFCLILYISLFGLEGKWLLAHLVDQLSLGHWAWFSS